MKIRMTNEVKTGVLVLISLVALLVVVLKVGNFTLLKKGYTVRCHLHYAAGVKRHAPVRWAGFDVGEVREIRAIYGKEPMIEMVLWIYDDVKIRKDALAHVATLGLMGAPVGSWHPDLSEEEKREILEALDLWMQKHLRG